MAVPGGHPWAPGASSLPPSSTFHLQSSVWARMISLHSLFPPGVPWALGQVLSECLSTALAPLWGISVTSV